MGAEEITIGATVIHAIEDETSSSNALARAATNNERTLVVKFPSDAFAGALKSGMTVTARDQAWQISGDQDSVKRGKVAITLTLVEPERRD